MKCEVLFKVPETREFFTKNLCMKQNLDPHPPRFATIFESAGGQKGVMEGGGEGV